MAYRHIVLIGVEHKVGIILIDSIVGKMHAHLLHVLSRGRDVGFSRKSRQSLLVDVDSHWIDCCQEHVYPKIEFEPFDEIRSMHISLHDVVLPRFQIFDPSCQKYPFTLRHSLGLYDVRSSFSFGLALKV